MQRQTRTNKLTILLNDSEYKVLERFCKKYHIQNRSKFIRETIIRNVLQRLEEDAPTLF